MVVNFLYMGLRLVVHLLIWFGSKVRYVNVVDGGFIFVFGGGGYDTYNKYIRDLV